MDHPIAFFEEICDHKRSRGYCTITALHMISRSCNSGDRLDSDWLILSDKGLLD